MKVKEFIEFVNNAIDTVTAKIESDEDYYYEFGGLYTLDDFEELIENSTECNGVEKVACELEIKVKDFHSCATDVYKCEDGYVGIHAGLTIDELAHWDRVDPDITVSEYEEVQIVTYKPKKCQSL